MSKLSESEKIGLNMNLFDRPAYIFIKVEKNRQNLAC